MDAAALVNVIAIPLVASAVVGLVMRWLRLAPRSTWATAVALGFIAGQIGLVSRAGVQTAFQSLVSPREARDWLPMCVMLAAGVTILSDFVSVAWRRWVLASAVLVSVAVPLRLVASNVRLANTWSIPLKLGCIVLLAVVLGFVWMMLSRPRDDDMPLLRLVLLVVAAVGSAVVITLAGTIIGGQLCAVLASALMGAAFGEWVAVRVFRLVGPSLAISAVRPQLSPLDGFGGTAAVVTMSLGGLIVLATFYAELTLVDAALLILALIAAGGPLPGEASSDLRWFQASIRVALAACPLAIAVVRNLPT
jgi:hypothetical protein